MPSARVPLPTDTVPPTTPRRPYTAPRLLVHGDVRALTLKEGPDPDLDGGGSFTAPPPDQS
jgi:hypothetical protein